MKELNTWQVEQERIKLLLPSFSPLWMLTTLIELARILQLPDNETLHDLPAHAVGIMEKLKKQ